LTRFVKIFNLRNLTEQAVIEFQLFGLQLQEPMALITNWMMSFFCLFAFVNLRNNSDFDVIWWKRFFFIFTISAFFGGLGHLFFQYFDKSGKFPNWITGILAGYCAGKAVTAHVKKEVLKKRLEISLVAKGFILLILSLSLRQFIFVAVDAIFTYVFFCGILAYQIYKKGVLEMKYFFIGTLICLPSAFIFLLKINPHIWFNKDDASHILMLFCLISFYIGASKLANKNALVLQKIS